MSSPFVLHHTPVSAADATPQAWLLVLHGIYGSGGNWRTFARKLVTERPDWGVLLVDLRMHGHSQQAPPPHDVTTAAADVLALIAERRRAGEPVRAILGHSFGGKVALQCRLASTADSGIDSTWVIDASPSARPGALDHPDNTVGRVLTMLTGLPRTFDSRRQFVAAVTEHGFPAGIGQWLAMNLEYRDDGYHLRLDTDAMRALLADYYRRDLWPALANGPGTVHVVVAGRSSAVSEDDRRRLLAVAADSPSVHAETIAEAGHWVHIDALPALLAVVAGGLPTPA